ncbi:hypothetical protein MKEN_00986500 [Mycena kentingensis (nom. inval.)]|nr:hypothetical protein MKEN_00986500 [Mycena kentingensis (nom. inval.)]
MDLVFPLEQLDRLPFSEKKVALAVCRDGCTFVDLDALRRLWRRKLTLELFLPVFAYVFQPQRMPLPQHILCEEVSERTMEVLEAASMVFGHINAIGRVVADKHAVIWRHVFRWAAFFVSFADSLLPTMRFARPLKETIDNFAQFTVETLPGYDPFLRPALLATPGFYGYLFRTWKLALEDTTDTDDFKLLKMLSLIVETEPDPASAPHLLEEILIGAGGTMQDAADLLVRHMRASKPGLAVYGRPEAYRIALTNFNTPLRLALLLMKLQKSTPELDAEDALQLALGNAKAMKVLLEVLEMAVGGVIPSSQPDYPFLLRNSFDTLRWIIEAEGSGHNLLCKAIRRGLVVHLSALCARPNLLGPPQTRPAVANTIAQFINGLLLPSTVFPSVISTTAVALAQCSTPLSGPLHSVWSHFAATVGHHRTLLSEYEARDLVLKACDMCNKVADRSNLRSCSECKAVLYCSPECQKEDWDVGHYQICGTHAKHQRTTRALVSKREQSFLRVLVHDAYKAFRSAILLQHAVGASRVVAFDFAAGTGDASNAPEFPRLKVLTGEQAAARMAAYDPLWINRVERAGRSDRRVLMHIVGLKVGGERYWLTVPLRMSGSSELARARSIVAKRFPRIREDSVLAPGEEKALEEKFKEFFESNDGRLDSEAYVEFH